MNQPAALMQVRWPAGRWRAAALLATVLVFSTAARGIAQDSDSASSDSPAGSPKATLADSEDDQPGVPPEVIQKAGRIQYVGPDTYILLDVEGRPQPVPGMTYEDFLAAWKRTQQPPNGEAQRRYSIERIEADGEARVGHARLRFTARVALLTDEAVDVPLGLLGAILDGEPRFAPADDSGAADDAKDAGPKAAEYLYFNPERGGFVVHFDGRAGERREVALELIVPLTRDGSETTLPLNCPRALASNLTLALDKPVANAVVNSGTLLATEPTPGGGVRLKVAGAMGAVRLTWHAGDPAAGEVATVLGAAGAIRVSIDGRSVRSDARLTVQSFGGSFDRFRVRLPAGAQLVRDTRSASEEENPAYRITVEDEPKQAAAVDGHGAAGQVVLVQLPEKQQAPAVVELSTEQPIGIEDGGPVVELGAFEVLGAVRQYGDVAVEVAGDWQARWDIGDHVRQVDPGELESSLQHAGLTAAFQYDRQPWSLGVKVAPRQFRVHVAPHYELEILPDEARLTVDLAYQVFGARAFEFRVKLAGWEVAEDPIDSGGLVDQDRVQVTPDDTLVLPLAQSSSRRAEITFAVRRALPRDVKQVRLPLPVPLADSLGTGELVVASAADVELLPDLAASSGLTPTPVTEPATVSDGSGVARHRFRISLPDAMFVAERLSRTREVSLEAGADIEMQTANAQIDQRFDYRVRYEPIKELHFDIPPELSLSPEETEIMLVASAGRDEANAEENLMPLSFVSTDNDTQSPGGSEAGQLRVALPQPRLGQFAVRIRYPLVTNGWERGTWRVPLFQPTDGRVSRQVATVRTPRNLAVGLDAAASGSSWKASQESGAVGAASSVQRYIADHAEASLPLLVRAVDPNLPSSTIVERVWLQTWLSGDVRQDRAAFRFRTTASQTTIELPPQVPPEEVEVLLEGRPAEVLSRGAGRILVRPPQSRVAEGAGESDAEWHTLELRYRQPSQRGLVQRHRLTPPQIVGTTALSEVYWQIALPGDRHIIQSPERMTSAGQWQWLGSFWGRRPQMSQAKLESWSGASAQVAPSTASSEHLYTGLAPVSTIEVITAPRWLIVLAASSVVLVGALIWIYVPRAQRSWILLGAAIVVSALAIAFPTPALLLAQASALGVVAAAAAVLIGRRAARPARWPVTLSSGSSQRQLTPRPDSMFVLPVATASTAPTAPLVLPDSER